MSTAISQAQFAFRKGTSSREEDMKVDAEFVAVFQKYNLRVQDIVKHSVYVENEIAEAFTELLTVLKKRQHEEFDLRVKEVKVGPETE